MPRVDFYLLEHHKPEDLLRIVCRIVDKAYQQQHHLLICCQDKMQSESLDKLLWTSQDTSFIPHVLWQNQSSIEAPIIIFECNQSLPPQSRDILINLTFNVLDFYADFQRIVEVVPADDTARKLARDRFRHYRDNGADLHTHQIK